MTSNLHPSVADHPGMRRIARRRADQDKIRTDWNRRLAEARAEAKQLLAAHNVAVNEAIERGELPPDPPKLPKMLRDAGILARFDETNRRVKQSLRDQEADLFRTDRREIEQAMSEAELDILSQAAGAVELLTRLADDANLLADTARQVRRATSDKRGVANGPLDAATLARLVAEGGGLLDVAGERPPSGLNVMVNAEQVARPVIPVNAEVDA